MPSMLSGGLGLMSEGRARDCRQERELTEAAPYHLLPATALSTRPTALAGRAGGSGHAAILGKLEVWECTRSSSIFIDSVPLWFSPALQMATRPGQVIHFLC